MAELMGSSLNIATKSGTMEDSTYKIMDDDAISTNKRPYEGTVYRYSSVGSVTDDGSSSISGTGILAENNVKRIQYPLKAMDYGTLFAKAEPITAYRNSGSPITSGYVLNGASMFSFFNKDKSDSVISLITMGIRKKPYENGINRYIKGRTKFN